MFMRTDRLFLRPIFQEDWREIYRGIADESIVRMLARAPWPYSEEDARNFCAGLTKGTEYCFAITVPGVTGAPLVGTVGFGPQAKRGTHEVGYWVAPDWQGQGIATEAVSGIVRMAEALGVSCLEASHFLDNPGSGRVLRKAGFTDTGEIRPMKSAGRANEKVLARRYIKPLAEPAFSLQPAAA